LDDFSLTHLPKPACIVIYVKEHRGGPGISDSLLSGKAA
jgi:hypothetical protein